MSDYTTTHQTTDGMTAMHSPKKSSRFIPLTILFLFLLFIFTVLKLPQTKITGLIQGHVQSALDPLGIYLSDRGRELSILKGFQYRLDHPTFELSDGTRVEMDEMVVSPSLLSLFAGKIGATLTAIQGACRIEVNGAASKSEQVNAKVNVQECDLGKLGLLAYAGGIKGSGLVSGDVQLDGSINDLPTLVGSIQLKLKKIRLEEQNLFGFQLPTVSVSDGTIEANLERGKLVIKTAQIGKNASDDLQISLTGEMTLNKFISASILNFRASVGMSPKLLQTISLLDGMLAPAKGSDGKYAYKLTGTLGAPFPLPDPQK